MPRNQGLAVGMMLRGRKKGDTDRKVLALPSEASKPAQNAGSHISTATAAAADQFAKTKNPPKSQALTGPGAEPEKANGNPRHRHSGSRTGSNPAAKSDQNRNRLEESVMKARQRRARPLSPGGRLSMQAVEPDGVWAATLAAVEFSKVSHRV